MGIFHTGFGIDLRQNHLILALLKKSFGRIRVVDSTLHPIPPEEQKEEREAQAQFGAAYSSYAAHTPAFVPRVRSLPPVAPKPIGPPDHETQHP